MMLKGISHWSIKVSPDSRDAIGEALDQAKAAGYEAIELAIAEEGPFSVRTEQETCEGFRRQAEERGLALETVASGMSWRTCPTDPDPAVRELAMKLNRDALQRTAWLGAQAYLYVPGAVKIPWNQKYGPVRYDQAIGWAKEGLKHLAETAEKENVDLCVENVWNGLLLSPLELIETIDQVGSEKVGVYFDVGNILGYHQHPPHWIEMLGRRIKRIHLKDYNKQRGFVDLTEGDVPWPETMAALRAIEYDRTLIAEMTPPSEGLLERTSQAIDRIRKM